MRPFASVALGLAVGLASAAAGADESANPGGRESYLSDEAKPLDSTIGRPRPWIQIGAPFLGTGPLTKGFELPGGAVWQPALLIFGTQRSAIQSYDNGDQRYSEWANRLDVFANLQLSGTERVLFGMRPFDRRAEYTGVEFEPGSVDAKGRFDADVAMLFFEGEIGELLPKLDLYDRTSLDFGFSVGRQPIELQDGMLIDDIIDSVGIVRNSLHTKWTSGMRINALYGWNNVNRGDNTRDDSAQLFALSALADVYTTTLEMDLVYIVSDHTNGDGFYGGLSAIQRFNLLGRSWNTTFRVLGSLATDHRTSEVGSGVLLFSQIGLTPHKTLNWLYLNAFCAIDRFTSASRAREAGGPLTEAGLLYSSPEIGRTGPALSNLADHAIGAALGYQMFFAAFRRQLVVELGGRVATQGRGDAVALGFRFQQAFGRHVVFQIDSHVSKADERHTGFGARTELTYKF